jgi:hypothetical protein
MLAKELTVRLTRWMPHDYSESRNHDHELEWYLWFEGREAYRLFDKGPSDVVPLPGYFEGDYYPIIHPRVVNNRFKVRLVAIERDGPQWLDPDDRAKGEFHIDLDEHGPYTTWSVVAADPDNTDLDVQVWFDILNVDYVDAPEIVSNDPPGIEDRLNWPYPWGNDVVVFEHERGLGRRSPLRLTDDRRVSRKEIWSTTGNPGMLKKSVQDIYRFGVGQLGIANDTMSSIFVPKPAAGRLSVTVHDHDFGDPRFAGGSKRAITRSGLYRLGDFGLNDRVSAVEIVHTYPKPRPGV